MENQYKNISSSYQNSRQSPSTLFYEAPSVVRALGDLANLDIIDFACGEGYYTRLMSVLGARSVVGADLSPEMIELARNQEMHSPLGIRYEVVDVAECKKIGEFDLATAIFLFNYAEKTEVLQKMFNSVAQNLRRKGRLIAVVPNPQFIPGRKETLKYGFFLEETERDTSKIVTKMTFTADKPFSIQFTQWSKSVYESCLTEAGFTEIRWIPFQVTAEGLEKFGSEFWATDLENPKSIILHATFSGVLEKNK